MNKKFLVVIFVVSLIGLTLGQYQSRNITRWIPEELPATYGCYRERCWSRCSRFRLNGGEWCWTASNRRETYKRCYDKYDCKPDMLCGSPCNRLRKW